MNQPLERGGGVRKGQKGQEHQAGQLTVGVTLPLLSCLASNRFLPPPAGLVPAQDRQRLGKEGETAPDAYHVEVVAHCSRRGI